jgi:hypothetical protein
MTTRIPTTWRDADHVRSIRDAVMLETRALIEKVEARVDGGGEGYTPAERLEQTELLETVETLNLQLRARERETAPKYTRSGQLIVPGSGERWAGDGSGRIDRGVVPVETRSLGQLVTMHPAFAGLRAERLRPRAREARDHRHDLRRPARRAARAAVARAVPEHRDGDAAPRLGPAPAYRGGREPV